MLANNQKHRNQVFIGSWILVIIGAFFAYFDIFSPEIKKIFGYIWLAGMLIQLIFGAFWTISKYPRGRRSFQNIAIFVDIIKDVGFYLKTASTYIALIIGSIILVVFVSGVVSLLIVDILTSSHEWGAVVSLSIPIFLLIAAYWIMFRV